MDNILSIMNSNTSQGLNTVLAEEKTLLRGFHKVFYLSSQFFIVIGISTLLLRIDKMKFTNEYRIISLATFIILVAGIITPYFANQLNTTRLFHICLIILAPFVIIGALKFLNIVFPLIKNKIEEKSLLKIISIYLVIFFLLDTGVVYQAIGQDLSLSLSNNLNIPKFNQKEVTSAKWLHTNYNNNYLTYSDEYREYLLTSITGDKNTKIPLNTSQTRNNYVFLGTFNIKQDKLTIYDIKGADISEEIYISPAVITANQNRIYDNGGANIYF